jgi:predicted nucleic acid-binding protein
MASPSGPAGRCLEEVYAGSIALFVSEQILAEFLEVSARPAVAAKLNLSATRTRAFAEELLANATFLAAVASVFLLPADPKDAMYVDLAAACDAHVITTRDRHLLALRDASDSIGKLFQATFPSIDVLTPVELLQLLRK